MEYQLKLDCERVILHVLVGADPSLVGLKVGNCSVISMKYTELLAIAIHTLGKGEENHVLHALADAHQFVSDNSKLIVLEIVEKDNEPKGFADSLIKALKLFKSGDIYWCYFLSYRLRDDKLTHGGIGIFTPYRHAISGVFPSAFYKITEEEKNQFSEWYEKYSRIIYGHCKNTKMKTLLTAYNQSYFIGSFELQFLMLFTCLEMVFGERFEITYQLSRGTALLISNSSEEMETVFKRVKKLYGARSGYVHNGKKIKIEDLYELREFVRRVLVKLLDLGYYMEEKKFDDLRTQITLGGFHTFIETGDQPHA